jgi:hypothetical protein
MRKKPAHRRLCPKAGNVKRNSFRASLTGVCALRRLDHVPWKLPGLTFDAMRPTGHPEFSWQDASPDTMPKLTYTASMERQPTRRQRPHPPGPPA